MWRCLHPSLRVAALSLGCLGGPRHEDDIEDRWEKQRRGGTYSGEAGSRSSGDRTRSSDTRGRGTREEGRRARRTNGCEPPVLFLHIVCGNLRRGAAQTCAKSKCCQRVQPCRIGHTAEKHPPSPRRTRATIGCLSSLAHTKQVRRGRSSVQRDSREPQPTDLSPERENAHILDLNACRESTLTMKISSIGDINTNNQIDKQTDFDRWQDGDSPVAFDFDHNN